MAVVSDYTALLSGSTWNGNGAAGLPVFVTFSFETSPRSVDSTLTQATFHPATEEEKTIARQAFRTWADACGIVFMEVPPGQGDIRLQYVDFYTIPGKFQYAGYGYYPISSLSSTAARREASYIYLNTRQETMNAADKLHLILHEIGHTLGLKHPFDGDPVLDPSLDNAAHTVMSYMGYAPALGTLDLQAIAFLYGSNAMDGTQVEAWSWNAATATLSQTGGAGDETIRGVSVADIMSGGAGCDLMAGFGGHDFLAGGEGDDTLLGGAGTDTLRGDRGNDCLYGGGSAYEISDFDWADYSDATAAITVDLTGVYDAMYSLVQSAKGDDIGFDTLKGIAGVIGGAGNDAMAGSIDANALKGNAGDDSLDGRAGEDTLDGGAGDDSLRGGEGDDSLVGGTGRDTAFYAMSSSAATWSRRADGTWSVRTASMGTDVLQDVEQLSFLDGQFNLDGRAPEGFWPKTVRRTGPEILVNATTARYQRDPACVRLADGRFVVAWVDGSESAGDTSFSAIRAQVLAPDGRKVGSEFLVNTTTYMFQSAPSVAALADGRFVVTWTDGSGIFSGVRGQMFNSDGSKAGREFIVKSAPQASESQPGVVGLADGGFVVSWAEYRYFVFDADSSDVWCQVFNADGSRRGSEFRGNPRAAGSQSRPSVTALSGGGFVLIWEDPIASGLRGQVFKADGGRVGPDFAVASSAASLAGVGIAALSSGGFVVTWAGRGDALEPKSMRAQVFRADGTKEGAERLVGLANAWDEPASSIAALPADGFVVAWTISDRWAATGAPRSAIRLRVYGADGRVASREFLVEGSTSGQAAPAIATLSTNRFLVTWTDTADPTGESSDDIHAQVFAVRPVAADIGGDSVSDVLFRSTAGTVLAWSLVTDSAGRPQFSGGGVIAGASVDWVVQGLGDFDGDGRSDILWRNKTSGTALVWQLDGTALTGDSALGGASADWSVAGIGDFDGDGKSDVLWRHAPTGGVHEWQMDGTAIKGGGAVGGASADWSVKGTGDFNGDGRDDILWQHTDGSVLEWLMDGTAIIGGGVVAGASTGWSLQGIADFDGDGKDDLLWRYTNGATLVWQLDGLSIKASGSHGAGGGDWSIQGTGDYNGDGLADILWRHEASDAVLVWTTAPDGFSTAAATLIAGADPREWAVTGNRAF
ncbi:FG-GAP-like repeat-containing protein [Alsobacter sp. R-9]